MARRRRFVRYAAVLAAALTLMACTRPRVRFGPMGAARTTTWLGHGDDTAGAPSSYGVQESVCEYARFDTEQPTRIWALRGRFHIPDDGRLRVLVWDDFGGNFRDFDRARPLAVIDRRVTTDDDGLLLYLPLDRPVDLVPGRMFYAGVVGDGPGAARLLASGTGDRPSQEPSSFAIRGFAEQRSADETLSSVPPPGHFLLEAEVEWIHQVSPADRAFEPFGPDLGLPTFSRIAVADVNGDGHDDVMLDGQRLFLGDGRGHFIDASAAWLPDLSGCSGGVFGDYDGDGDPDYFATAVADRLLRNDGDHFTDVTAASGIDDTQDFVCDGRAGPQHVPTEAAAWLDYDGDGRPDLYQANYQCTDPSSPSARDFLWHNDGDGAFTDATLGSGALVEQPFGKAGRGVAPADANGDGWQDLLVTNYRLHENFFLQNGAGVWRSRGEASGLAGTATVVPGGRYYGHSIGAAWGDVDGDGDLDVFVANLAHPRFIAFSQKATLYLNDGAVDPVFEDVTSAAGIRYLETPSNPTLWDWDADGDLDLFFTCVYPRRTSQMYRNDGHGKWTEVTYETGLAVYNAWGAAAADVDEDGDLDLLVGTGSFRNRNLSRHGSVLVRVRGLGGPGHATTDGLGARIVARVGGRLLVRERVGAHGTGVQDSPWLHLGLGDATSVDFEVRFPATTTGPGPVVPVTGVPAGARVTVVEDGTVTVTR